MPELFHFVHYGEEGLSVSPLCADWQHNFAWTTVPAVVTCTACLALLKLEAHVQERGSAGRAPSDASQQVTDGRDVSTEADSHEMRSARWHGHRPTVSAEGAPAPLLLDRESSSVPAPSRP